MDFDSINLSALNLPTSTAHSPPTATLHIAAHFANLSLGMYHQLDVACVVNLANAHGLLRAVALNLLRVMWR
jgi:hypothetical protein